MTYEITSEDWEDAEEALRGKINGTTLSKYPQEYGKAESYKIKWLQLRKHTFVIIDEVIYALSKKEDCSPVKEGNLTFRQAISKTRKEVVIQIEELYPHKNILNSNLNSNKDLDVDLFGFEEKTLKSFQDMVIQPKDYEKPLYPKQRVYTLVKNPSQNLMKSIKKNKSLSTIQKMICSLRICLLMQELHDNGGIYRNITADNFALEIQGQDIKAKFTNLTFCQFSAEEDMNYSPILDFAKLIGFISPEVYFNQHFTVFSDYFSLAIMLFFQIDITGNHISDLYFNKYIDAACQAYELQGKLINPIEWIEENNKIKIEPAFKKILFNMLHPYPGERKGLNHLITYLCEKLLLKKEINIELKQELELLLSKYKPSSPTLIFSPFQMPDIFSPVTDNSVLNKNRLHSYF